MILRKMAASLSDYRDDLVIGTLNSSRLTSRIVALAGIGDNECNPSRIDR
jgi:hypothetical protein